MMDDDEELQRAFRMSLMPEISGSPGDLLSMRLANESSSKDQFDERATNPEAKRTKGDEATAIPSIISSGGELTNRGIEDDSERRRQREIRAKAAERRMQMSQLSADADARLEAPLGSGRESASPSPAAATQAAMQSSRDAAQPRSEPSQSEANINSEDVMLESVSLSSAVADQLFHVVFGPEVTKEVLVQWSRQGFRFSTDSATSLGLVQHKGGPCGVLAPVQALVLKYLHFTPPSGSSRSESSIIKRKSRTAVTARGGGEEEKEGLEEVPEEERMAALVCAMAETLWQAGGQHSAIVATLDDAAAATHSLEGAHSLTGVEHGDLLDGKMLQRILRIIECSSLARLQHAIRACMRAFESGLGALLMLFSALLSRRLDRVAADRDDPSQPLVSAPFGHAAQEIVNLLLCGRAVAHVFDDVMDLGGGLRLQGVPSSVQVGFLTLLESLQLCKVGQNLKEPKWPIWVVGSESHYTVLFALSNSVQEESEMEMRESRFRKAFDALDASGGGGLITPEALDQLLARERVNLSLEVRAELTASGVTVWQDLWRAVSQLDESQGGFKAIAAKGPRGHRRFEVYHFNGIAKSVSGEVPLPRLTKMRVSVPPKWTPDTVLMEDTDIAGTGGDSSSGPVQHAPLVDCVRTRWPRATCTWVGETPSIV